MSDLVSVRRHPAGFLEGQGRPGSGRHGEIIARFLQSDVQSDLETARMLLAEIAAAERGEKPQAGGVGNAFSIMTSPDGAVIRNAVVEGASAERYSLPELRPRSRPGSLRSNARRSTDPTALPLTAGENPLSGA
ncbi:MAG TPA: hypothetical protein VJX94_14795 [Stellaceae bacterium]|nr:hypothetical protein [Stellaceae bacterium]